MVATTTELTPTTDDNIPTVQPFLLRGGKKDKSLFGDRKRISFLTKLDTKLKNKNRKILEDARRSFNFKQRTARLNEAIIDFDIDKDEKLSGPNVDTGRAVTRFGFDDETETKESKAAPEPTKTTSVNDITPHVKPSQQTFIPTPLQPNKLFNFGKRGKSSLKSIFNRRKGNKNPFRFLSSHHTAGNESDALPFTSSSKEEKVDILQIGRLWPMLPLKTILL